MSPRLERLLPWALALVCLIFDPSALADAPKRTLALLLSLGLLVRALGRGEALRLPRATSCLLVIVGLVGVSALYGSGARWLLLGNWWLIAALAVVLGELELEVARGVMARTALLVSLGTSAWLLASWLCGARGMLLHAGQGNPNWAGLVLAIAWPLSLRDASFARARSVLVLGYGVACATALALSESRVAWLAVGVAWVGLTFRSTSRRHAFAQLALLVGAISLTALPSPIGASSARPATNVSAAHPASRAATRAAPELDHSARTSLSGRIWIQRVALRQAIARLPWGTGLGGFFPAFLSEQGRALAALGARQSNLRFSNATTAHDDWLELLVEAGPLPPLLLLIAIAMAARASEPHPAAALVALAVCALGDSPFHLPAVCVLVAVIFAALPRERPLVRKRLLVLLLGAGGALLLAQSFGGWFASRLTTAARSEMPEGRRKLLERAVRLAPASSEYALELGLARRDAGDLTGALQMLERSVALGGDVASFVALGNVALEAGESPRARAAFEAALARNPGSVRAHTGLGEALRHLGKLSSAEEHVRVALELRPGDLDLRNRLDSLREQRLDDELDSERFGEPNVLGESGNSR